MIQLNLLPDLKKDFINAQKTKGLVISIAIFVALGAIGLSALLFVYVTFIQQVQINLTNDAIAARTSELKQIEDVDKYLTVQNQLASLPTLHGDKGLYSRMFDFLTVLNPSPPNNIKLNNLEIQTADTSIVFTGTTQSFETLNVFVDTLKNAQVTYKEGGEGEPVSERMFDIVLVESSGLSRLNNQVVVAFAVRTFYKDAVFAVKNTDMSVTVPSITTTPSVTQSPRPGQSQQLFDQQEGQ